MPSSDTGLCEAILRIATEYPAQVVQLIAPPAPEAFPAGPLRYLWEGIWQRAAIGLPGPIAMDGVVDLLRQRGVPLRQAHEWWASVLGRTTGVPHTSFLGLIERLREDHARAGLMLRAGQALGRMREMVAVLAPVEEIRGVMASALEPTEGEAAASGLVGVVDAERVSRERLQQSRESGGSFGLGSGIAGLDKVIGPLAGGQLTVVAARAKVGKTHFATQVVGHVTGRPWRHLGRRVAAALIVSLEMDPASVFDRMLAWESESDYAGLMRKGLTDEAPALEVARHELIGRPIHFLDVPGVTVGGIAARARALARRGPIDLLVVDYLDLVRPNRATADRHDLQLGGIVRDLLSLARELQAHVLLVVQINREGDREATIRHLANSDEIGRAAHNVLILNRGQDDPFGVLDEPGHVNHVSNLVIDVTSRGPGTGARVPITLDKRTSRISDAPAPVDARRK
jgi:hypothetical protein